MTSRTSIIGITCLSLCSIPLLALAFSDVPSSHVHGDAILYMQDNGIVQGYTDGTFKPESQINRAEFTKIIVGAVTQTISGRNCFPDVKEEWFAPYVCTAKTVNIIGGYPDGTFGPTKTITFAEAAKIIVNAFGTPENTETDGPWYKPFVVKLGAQDAIPTDITDFSQPVTRGAMAEMIFRLRTKNMDKSSRTYEELAGEKNSSSSSRMHSTSSTSSVSNSKSPAARRAEVHADVQWMQIGLNENKEDAKNLSPNDAKEFAPLLQEYEHYVNEIAAYDDGDAITDEEYAKIQALKKSSDDVHSKMFPYLLNGQIKQCAKLQGDYFYNPIYSSQEIMLKLSAQECPTSILRIQECKSIAVQAAASYEGNLHMPETLEAAECPPNPFWVKP